MLLRNHNNAYFTDLAGNRVDPYMCIPCCHAWGQCPGTEPANSQGWPNCRECFMDAAAKRGCDTWHWRLGPWWGDYAHEGEWADVGGPYVSQGVQTRKGRTPVSQMKGWKNKPLAERRTVAPAAAGLPFNESYWQKMRDLAWRAMQRGQRVEVVIVDDWWLKFACGLEESCEKQVPWPASDVDAWGKQPSPEAERLLRKGVSELGCFGNVIWATGNEEDLIPGTTVSHLNWRIQIIRDEEQKTGCGFVHVIGTGSDKSGINADYSITHQTSPVTAPCRGRLCVDNEHNPAHSAEQEADYFHQARSAGQVWAAWRAEADDPSWEQRLTLFKNIVDGDNPVGCFPPPGDDPEWVLVSAGGGMSTQLRDAIELAKIKVGSQCGTDHAGSLRTLDLLGTEMRAQGYCAGRLDDALFAFDAAGDQLWKENHAVSFASGCYSNDPAMYPKNTWRHPSAQTQQCPQDVPTVDEILVKPHVPVGMYDATPKAHGQPILPEGDPNRWACELKAMGGSPPVYTLGVLSGNISLELQPNPMQFRIVGSGAGTVRCTVPAVPQTLCNANVSR